MTDRNEKLSLLLDDYSEDNIDETIDKVIGDVNAQYRMRRYRIIGETMRNELPRAIDTDFHNTVMMQIRDQAVALDPAPTATQKSVLRHPLLSWMSLKPLAGFAVAASVALVTVALWQPLKQESGQFDEDLVSTTDQQKIEKLAGQQLSTGAVPVLSLIHI